MTVSKRFRTWVQHTGGQAKAAECLGVSRPMVSMLCTGAKLPGLRLAVRIEMNSAAWVLGPIRPWEWVSEPRVP